MSELPLSLRKKINIMTKYPAYAHSLSNNLTNHFEIEIKNRMKLGKNMILEIVGETGSGKTYCATTIGAIEQKAFNKKLSIDNFAWTNTGFIEKAQKLGKKNTIIKDEQPRQIFGEGSTIEMVTSQDLEEVVRKAQQNMTFVSPSSRAFHTGVHYILQTFDLDYETRSCLLMIHEPNDHALVSPFGHIIIKHPVDRFPYLKPVMVAYEKKKDDFIKDAQNQTSRAKFFENLQKKSKQLETDEGFNKLKGMDDKLAYVYKYYPKLASQLSKSLLESVIRMAVI